MGGPQHHPEKLTRHQQDTDHDGPPGGLDSTRKHRPEQPPRTKDQRQQLADAAVLVLVEKFGHAVARHLVDALGRPEVVAAFPRVLATQHAQQLHADRLSPRDASYRIAELTGMSVRNARRYADAATHEI